MDTVHVVKCACRAGRNAPKPCAALSEEDVRHIQNLDYLVKAWYKWRDMLVLQAKVVQHEADLNAIGRCPAQLLTPLLWAGSRSALTAWVRMCRLEEVQAAPIPMGVGRAARVDVRLC